MTENSRPLIYNKIHIGCCVRRLYYVYILLLVLTQRDVLYQNLLRLNLKVRHRWLVSSKRSVPSRRNVIILSHTERQDISLLPSFRVIPVSYYRHDILTLIKIFVICSLIPDSCWNSTMKKTTNNYCRILIALLFTITLSHQNTGLFEMIVGALTTCHTQYT